MVAAYAVTAYLAFLAAVLSMMGFLLGFGPAVIDRAPAGSALAAVFANLGLITLFGLAHSVMARARFKNWLARWIPAAAERSTFVLIASLLLIATALLWRPLPEPIWTVRDRWVRLAVTGVAVLGWMVLIGSTFAIDHFEQFGLRPALLPARDSSEFVVPLPYRIVRHPQYFGLLLVFWAAPDLTVGRLLFAAGMTGYILVGVRYEERDLLARFGDRYAEYRRRVRMLLPFP